MAQSVNRRCTFVFKVAGFESSLPRIFYHFAHVSYFQAIIPISENDNIGIVSSSLIVTNTRVHFKSCTPYSANYVFIYDVHCICPSAHKTLFHERNSY